MHLACPNIIVAEYELPMGMPEHVWRGRRIIVHDEEQIADDTRTFLS